MSNMFDRADYHLNVWRRLAKQMKTLPPTRVVLRSISPAAVLLGLTLNVLDAVSMGLLIFPSAENGSTTFAGLQTQAMSLFVMSTILSQLAMTLGGSLFPGALGAMFLEILPFLRSIATSIQDKLGDGHPGVLPTVMATYALTSLLTGIVFLGLGVLRCGRLVEYFPTTVLTGAIGAIGVSLFVLGLELTIPTSSDDLSFSTAGHVLFNHTHVPLLVVSLSAAIFLSTSIRSTALSNLTCGFTKHPLYLPLYCFSIAALFWIVAAGAGYTDSDGLASLRTTGWLFTVEESTRPTGGLDWNYWALSDFSLVEWSAILVALKDIALLVLLAVVSLPIYIPAMALTLNVPEYNMNWELLGHGVSNTLAGLVGTVPNLVFFTNSRFFTLADGGRIEALIVTALTTVAFFFMSYILPYVPTILAATLVIFLGIELTMEAIWKAPQQLTWSEWLVVMTTILACSFLGFVIGVGAGVGTALLVHLWWSVVESRPKIIRHLDAYLEEAAAEEYTSSYLVRSKKTMAFDSCGSLESQPASVASSADSFLASRLEAFRSCDTLNERSTCRPAVKGKRDFAELSLLPTSTSFFDSCTTLETQSDTLSLADTESSYNTFDSCSTLNGEAETSGIGPKAKSTLSDMPEQILSRSTDSSMPCDRNSDPIELLFSAIRGPSPQSSSQPIIIRLTNYVGFIELPAIEAAVKSSQRVILDFSHAKRTETCVTQFLQRQFEEARKSSEGGRPKMILLVGVRRNSGLQDDLRRGGLECCWVEEEAQSMGYDEFGLQTLAFPETNTASKTSNETLVLPDCNAALEYLRAHTGMNSDVDISRHDSSQEMDIRLTANDDYTREGERKMPSRVSVKESCRRIAKSFSSASVRLHRSIRQIWE